MVVRYDADVSYYNESACPEMVESPTGDYVRYDDYMELEKKLERIQDMIKELWMVV